LGIEAEYPVIEDLQSLINSGNRLLNSGKYEKAIELFQEAQRLAYALNDRKNEVSALLKLGLLQWNIGDLENSYKYYEKAETIAMQSGLSEGKEISSAAKRIHDDYQLGKELMEQSRFEESTEAFKRAVRNSQKIGSKHHELKCIRRMSINFWEMSDYEEFFILNDKALQIARELNHEVEIGRALNNIGLYRWRNDNYSYALAAYTEALEIAQQKGKSEEISKILNNIGIIYKELGNSQNALANLSEALKIDRKLGDEISIAIDLNNIGTIYKNNALSPNNIQDLSKSIRCYEESLKLAQKNSDSSTEIAVLNNIGNLYAQSNEPDKATQYLIIGLDKAIKEKKYSYIANLYTNLGFVAFRLIDYSKSEMFFDKAIEIGQRIGAYNILWESYYGLGLSHEKREDFDKAEDCYNKSIELIDRLRSRITLDVDKAGFARDKLAVYQDLISLYYRKYVSSQSNTYAKKIYRIIEKAKSRAFLDLLDESRVNIREKMTPGQRKKEKEIKKRIADNLELLSKSDISSSESRDFSLELREIEDEYIAFLGFAEKSI